MKLKKLIQNLALDKKEHIVVGVVYSALIPILGFLFGEVGAFIGLVIGTSFNVWKEIYNDFIRQRGNAELLDFIATQAPILIAYLSFLL